MARLSALHIPLSGVLLALVAGCPGNDDGQKDDSGDSGEIVDTYVAPEDADGDGQTAADGDCDDTDPDVFVGQVEICDGLDNNCNEVVDEGLPDSDRDGTANCMDVEECDGLDNDGDELVDEEFDANGDGVADCEAVEVCDGVDNDADGDVDEGFDADGDGYTTCGDEVDCNDANADVNPGAREVDGDGVDNDCDGSIDAQTWATGDLIFTEVMVNPQTVADPRGEWIEVLNVSGHEVTLNGLQFISSDGDWFQVLGSNAITLAAGEYFVFGSNVDTDTNGDVSVGYAYSGFSLSNEGDDISVFAGSTMVASLTWDDGTEWPEAVGASLMVDPEHYGETDATYWCAATEPWGANPGGDRGSPGALNELCSTYDHDGDGFSGDEGDCDDANDTIYPGAYEADPTLDNDCDGVVEWGPVASAASSGDYACNQVSLSSSGSYDPDGGALTYSWELVSAPSGSAKTTADINTATSANPTMYTDVAGTYVFALTVNDGGTNSLPATTRVTVSGGRPNLAPSANAGTDQSGSGSANCNPVSYGVYYECDVCSDSQYTLSATSSTDPNGDEMTYAWAITSGSYGTLSASEGDSVTLTVSGVTAAYPTAASETVTVQLTATDCMGASATDTVSVTYTCSGT